LFPPSPFKTLFTIFFFILVNLFLLSSHIPPEPFQTQALFDIALSYIVFGVLYFLRSNTFTSNSPNPKSIQSLQP
jgi:hypothetical protein